MFLHGWEIANHDHSQRGCDVNISTRLRRPIHGLSKRFEKKNRSQRLGDAGWICQKREELLLAAAGVLVHLFSSRALSRSRGQNNVSILPND